MPTSISLDQGGWINFYDLKGRPLGRIQMGERHGRRTKLCLDFPQDIRFVREECDERRTAPQTTPGV